MANSFKNFFLKNANTTSQNVYAAGAGVQLCPVQENGVPARSGGGVLQGTDMKAVARACQLLTESAAFMPGQNISRDCGMRVKMIYV